MRYLGGKCKIAKPLSELILQKKENAKTFVSLFCGGCAIETKLAPHFENVICNDLHPYLIAMYQALQNGYDLPKNISEEQYRYIREHKDEDKALTGFVGFGCSFGGRWFGSYARDKNGVNYAKQGRNAIMRDFENLKTAKFTCADYRSVDIPDGSIVYADPPYAGVTGYSTGKFDSTEFWEYMRKISEKNTVFISELQAPDDFVCVWQKEILRTLNGNSKRPKSVEKLFVHKSQI